MESGFFNFTVCDIEAAKWTEFVTIGFFDGKTFSHFENLDDFLHHVFSVDTRNIYAHFGGKYDFLFLIEAVLKNERFVLGKFVMRSSSVLFFEVFLGKQKRVFRDTAAFLPFSLKTLTAMFKTKHQKLDFNASAITKVTPEVLKYLEHDCKGLYETILNFSRQSIIRLAGMRHTVASQAFAIWKKTYPKKLVPLPENIDAFVRKGYFGGRVEIYKPFFREGKLHCYDVNSLFPSQMLGDFPFHFDSRSNEYDEKLTGFWNVKVRVPQSYICPLGVVRNGKLIFPWGEFWGTWSSIELKYLKELGGEVLECRDGVVFDTERTPLKTYVSHFWNERQKTAVGTPENILSKLYLNSLYGKFGFRRDRDELTLDVGLIEKGKHELKIGNRIFTFGTFPKKMKSFSNVAVSAWVTALSRIYVHTVLAFLGNEVWYTDTDSFFTTRELPTSTTLGGLKLEQTIKSAVFLLPKTYLTEGLKKKVVMKGFSRDAIQDFTFEDFEGAFRGEFEMLKAIQKPKFLTLKSAIRSGKLVNTSKLSTRQIRSKYDKRIFVKRKTGWDTVPIHLKE
jgi:hypothetical protein